MWKSTLSRLEKEKRWDEAINFMEEVIKNDQKNLDAYLLMLYLLMNLLVEEDYNVSKHDYYAFLAKKYFDISYELFSSNPKYLYFIGRTAFMSEWYFGLEYEEAEAMYNKAMVLEQDNVLYKWAYYTACHTKMYRKTAAGKKATIEHAQSVMRHKEDILSQLRPLGALGEYVEMILFNWSKRLISESKAGLRGC